MHKLGKVAVLMGGDSAEREISLQSGRAVESALIRSGVQVEAIDTASDYISKLINNNFNRVFIALHGPKGEDGTIQGFLESINLPYTGSGVLGSALSMDKVRSKRIWQSLNIATPPFTVWDGQQTVHEFIDLYNFPLAVKPVHEGSSVAVTKVVQMDQFLPACHKAAEYGEVMIEPWILGDEYTVPILGNRALPSILIKARQSFYDYSAKYLSGDTEYICPSQLDAASEEGLGKLSLTAFASIAASGWGRLDFIRDLQGKFWLLEVNTIPGMTLTSLVPKSAQAVGITFDQLVLNILEQTLSTTTVSITPESTVTETSIYEN